MQLAVDEWGTVLVAASTDSVRNITSREATLRACARYASSAAAPPAFAAAAIAAHAAALRKRGRLVEAQGALLASLRLQDATPGAAAALGPRTTPVHAGFDGEVVGEANRERAPWWRLEEAKLLFAQGMLSLGINLLTSLLHQHGSVQGTALCVPTSHHSARLSRRALCFAPVSWGGATADLAAPYGSHLG